MDKKTLGITIQVISVILWVAIPVNIIPWKALIGIGGLIIGGVIWRQGKKPQQ